MRQKQHREPSMSSISDTAISGLKASELRVNVAAQNIANADSNDYTPKKVVEHVGTNGSVSSEIVDQTPAQLSLVNADGQVEEQPNVSLDQQVVDVQLGTYNFKANATVLATTQQLQKRLLDIVA
jgi:flagellar basal body rod protein FlgC